MSVAPTGALPAATAVSMSATALAAPPGAATAARAAGTATGATTVATAGSGTPSSARAAATKAATQFERVLLEQLTKQLAATAAPEGDDASAATSAYRDMLPGTMADALSQAGGIGIAAQLRRAATATSPPAAAPAATTDAPAPAGRSSVVPTPTGSLS